MTQLQKARNGEITPQMREAARNENIEPKTLVRKIANGTAVLTYNTSLNKAIRPVAFGEGLKTKVNANIGTSRDNADVEIELCKARVAEATGADAVMDLSTGGDLRAIRRAIINEVNLPVGTVPVYEVASKFADRNLDFNDATFDDMLQVIVEQAEDGVSFMTVHSGVTRDAVTRLVRQKRKLNIVSRGGALLAEWMSHHDQENPLYEHFDRLIEVFAQYDITFSLGDGLRPGCLSDGTDRAQVSELVVLGELADRARDGGAQVMIEGPGHLPINQVVENITLMKRLTDNTPFYVLGPLVTDIAPGYDHITSAIGGAMAAAAGADFLCYVTPAEHLCLPNLEDVHKGVIAARIAAHAGDIAKGILGAREWDDQMAEARRELDWKLQIELSIDPEEAEKRRNADSPTIMEETCTMCSNLCAVKRSTETIAAEREKIEAGK
ncbi:MAG: phosphomethylpyrimidine synthase ThiC [bacterium]|nr:phosphomethylpyrimidine synthase ThiC [bacterium]